MEMEERNEWIVNYLKGKTVKITDLEEFFTIENNYKDIKKIKVENCIYKFITDDYKYEVYVVPYTNTTTTYCVERVTYEENAKQCV